MIGYLIIMWYFLLSVGTWIYDSKRIRIYADEALSMKLMVYFIGAPFLFSGLVATGIIAPLVLIRIVYQAFPLETIFFFSIGIIVGGLNFHNRIFTGINMITEISFKGILYLKKFFRHPLPQMSEDIKDEVKIYHTPYSWK